MSEPVELLGKYQVIRTLGKGAMGVVYEAMDPVIDRLVAIKTTALPDRADPQAEEALARFKREAQAAGRLHHPNIVGVFDYGETELLAFIVMEFVEGRSLDRLLSGNQRLTLANALRVLGDVLSGLAYSHERGVVHRDIKPSNIIITTGNQAKIADFGIARIESSNLTQAGTVLGTPAYMSPEQFMGQIADRRSDIYSAGVVLYQLLTGERPFEGSLTSIMHKVLNSTPPRPSELSVTVPPTLDAVVARAMARRPEDRFDTAGAFAAALAEAAAGGGDATIFSKSVIRDAPTPPARALPALAAASGRRFGLPAVAIGAAVLVLAASAAWYGFGRMPDSRRVSGIALALPPAAPAPAPPPRHTLTDTMVTTLVTRLSEVGCSLTHVSVTQAGAVSIAGVAGQGPPEAAVRAALQAAAPTATDWQVRLFDGPYCDALDVLRPVIEAALRRGDDVQVTEADGRDVLKQNDPIAATVAMPPYGGYLHLADLQNDGTVSVLVPSADYPAQTYAARDAITLGRPQGRFRGWNVAAPFGTDMLIAVVTSAPLFDSPPASGQKLTVYLTRLGAAIGVLQRQGGRVSAGLMVLQTRPGG